MNQTGLSRRPVRACRLLGAAAGFGARDTRCESAPDRLRRRLLDTLHAHGLRAQWAETIRPALQFSGEPVHAAYDVCSKLASSTHDIVQRGEFPLVIGGDHSCAIGTWKGVARALSTRGGLGLLWIDAHMDAHTAESTPSGLLHGMPVACLLGEGYPKLTAIAGAMQLDPRHLCLYGVRSFEADEAALLTKLGVRAFSMEEIERRGITVTLREALAIVSSSGAGFGVSIDLDAIDPRDAPGVGTPERGGLRGAALTAALTELADEPGLVAIEIAEYNPFRDEQDTTARLVEDFLTAMLVGAADARDPARLIALEQRHGAHNYEPLPVVLAKGKGVYIWDHEGRCYFDMMSAYSAVSHGHGHPRLTRALAEQAETLAVTSRAYYNNRLPLFLKRLCEITGQEAALPVNTGLEAVETALKAARKWGAKVKGIPQERVEIIACDGNFHGRSIAILSMSSEAQYRDGFGPFPAGFKRVPYGDARALERAITPHTAAFLVEPIQGEAGIIVPPAGYLAECARICRAHDVLLICDEVQTGLGRTGRILASEHEDVMPDGLILGKALGGGLLPVSAFLARRKVMDVFSPGDHGSTFGGNPLAAAVGLEALEVMIEEHFAERAAELGDYFLSQLRALRSPLVRSVRGKGLLIGVEIDPAVTSARHVCDKLLAHGILSKDTHETVVRFAPPLVITRAQLDSALVAIRAAFEDVAGETRHAA
jgi:ornithine--oxo-acid transaminase